MYKVIVRGRHDNVSEVARVMDWPVALAAFDFYVSRGFTWVLINQRVGKDDKHWVSRKASPAVMMGGE
jgi:hypothetical protein